MATATKSKTKAKSAAPATPPAVKSKPEKSSAAKSASQATTTAMVDLKTLLPNVEDFVPRMEGKTASGSGPGLPIYKIVWPIEAVAGMVGKCVINIGGDMTPLEKPYLLSCLGVRNMARDLVPGSDGNQVYNRAYEGGKSDKQYQEYLENKGKGKVQAGKSILLALIPDAEESDSCLICMSDLAGTAEGYFMPLFCEGLYGHGKASLVTLFDHMPNLVPSKKDKTRKYFAPWKFTQHSAQELTNEQKLLIAEACTNAAGAIGIWKSQ